MLSNILKFQQISQSLIKTFIFIWIRDKKKKQQVESEIFFFCFFFLSSIIIMCVF